MDDLVTRAALSDVIERAEELARIIATLPAPAQIECLNAARAALHAVSPFRDEPVDYVAWVPADFLSANDYNPNTVAAPEMRLLELSILADGYTQPIVTHHEAADRHIVVDGFHRSRVGKESKDVRKRVRDHLPVVHIRASQADIPERMASTIRHNRARGKHGVEPMTGIVAYLAKKGWDNEKIGRQLGMEPDEVLRFKQITGLAELFRDREFTEAWDIAS